MALKNLSLIAIEKDGKPFARIRLDTSEIKYLMKGSGEQLVNLTVGDLTGSYFASVDDKLIERKLLGDIASVNEYELVKTNLNNCYEDISNKLVQQKCPTEEKTGNDNVTKEFRIKIEVTMPTKGSMDIKITLNQLKVFLATKIYLRLLDFLSGIDTVLPKQPEIGKLKLSK